MGLLRLWKSVEKSKSQPQNSGVDGQVVGHQFSIYENLAAWSDDKFRQAARFPVA